MSRIRAMLVLVATVPVFLWVSPCTCFPHLGQHEQSAPSPESPGHEHGHHDHPGEPQESGGGHDHDDAPCCCEITQPELLVIASSAAAPADEIKVGNLAAWDVPTRAHPLHLIECVEHPPPRDGPIPGDDPSIFLLNCALLR